MLSPTKITTYLGCSMAYFLRYIQHEKVPLSFRMLFGKEIHYLLEQFYKKNYKSSESFSNSFSYRFKSSIAGDFLKGKDKNNLEIREIPYTRKNKDTENLEDCALRIGNHVNFGDYYDDEIVKKVFFGYRNLGANMCRRFYIKHKPLKPPVETEWRFGQKNRKIEINGIPIQGIFDRIDEKNKKWYITDYKTDKSSPARNSFILHRNIQFTTYSYVFRKLFEIEEEAILYYHLRSLKTFKTHRSEKDYDHLRRSIDKVAEGIDKDDFVPFYGFHCGWCDLKPACEKYCMDYHGGPRIDDSKGRIKPAPEFKDLDIDIPEEYYWINMGIEER